MHHAMPRGKKVTQLYCQVKSVSDVIITLQKISGFADHATDIMLVDMLLELAT